MVQKFKSNKIKTVGCTDGPPRTAFRSTKCLFPLVAVFNFHCVYNSKAENSNIINRHRRTEKSVFINDFQNALDIHTEFYQNYK